MKFSRHNQQQQTKVLNDNARFKLYKSKTRWLVSKRVLGGMVATAAVGIGLSLGMTGTAYADTTVSDAPTDQQVTPSEPVSGTTDPTTDVPSQEIPVDQPTPQNDGTTATDTPAATDPTTTTSEDDTLKGDGSETSTTPVDATRPITATDSQSSSDYFTTGGTAVKNDGKTTTSDAPTTTADETSGSFTLTQDKVTNQAGNVIFNNDVDMTQDWEISGSFKFSKDDDKTADANDTSADNDSDWGEGFNGWNIGDGAGIVISSSTQKELGQGGAGNAFGVGGIGNSIAAVIDTYFNTETESKTAPNGVDYTQVPDESVFTNNGQNLDNDPGTLQVIGDRWIDSKGEPQNGVGLDITGPNNDQKVSAGGAAIANHGLNQSVIKFITTNADGTVVTPDETTEKAYSPSSAKNSSTAANAAGERFVATWTPDLSTWNKETGTITGTLTITWYGNDDSKYKDGFTISTQYTASENSSIGLISSNGDQTATTVATVDNFTVGVKSQLVTIDYHVNGTDAPELHTSNVNANIGDTLAVSPDGTTKSDVNLTLPKLQGYHVSQITMNGEPIAADQVTMTVSRAAAANTLLVTYEPDTFTTTVTVPTTLVQTNGDETSGTITISDVTGNVGETVTVDGIPATYTDENGTRYTTTETSTQGLVNADGSITVKTPVVYTAIPMRDATITYVDTTTGKTVMTTTKSGQEGTTSNESFVTADDGTYTTADGTVYGLADGQANSGNITFVDGDADNVTVNLIELTTQSDGTISVAPVILIETNEDDSTLSKNVISNSDTGNISFTDTANKTTNTNTWQNDGNSYTVDTSLLPRDDSYDYANATVKAMDQNGQVIETLTGVDLNDIIDSTTGELKTIFLNVPQGSQLSGSQVLGKTGVATGDAVVMTGAENGLSDVQKVGTTVIISVPGEETDYFVQPTLGDNGMGAPVSEHGVIGMPITIPTIPGYNPVTTDQKVPISGVVKVEYAPAEQTVTVVPTLQDGTTIPVDKDINLDVKGNTDTKVDAPTIPGYEPTTQVEIPAEDGTTATIVYTPTQQKVTVEPVLSDGTPIDVADGTDLTVTGTTKKDITAPKIPGYTTDQKVTIPSKDGNQQIVYTPTEQTVTVNPVSSDGTQMVITDGTILTVSGVTNENVDAPAIPGYTTDQKIKIQSEDGTQTVTYTPTEQTVTIVPINSSTGKTITTDTPLTVTGTTGSDIDKLPEIPGYSTTETIQTPTQDGSQNVSYTPNTVTGKVKIPSNKGDITVDNITGQTDQTVTVEVPEKPGYTVDHNKVTATVKPDGTITTDETVTYTPSPVTGTVTIPSNKGDVTVDGVTVEGDQSVDVKVPSLPGYTPDHDTISAHLDTDGNITTDDKVIYTPIVTNQPDNSGTGQNTGNTSGNDQNTDNSSAPKNDDQTNQPSVVIPDQSDGLNTNSVHKPTDLASVSETVTPIHIASHGAHKGTTLNTAQSSSNHELASAAVDMVPALASETGSQATTTNTQRADDQGAVSIMQNDIAGATTRQQAAQNETLPQTDEQASAYSMMGLFGILMSFLGLGVTRKKHDVK